MALYNHAMSMFMDEQINDIVMFVNEQTTKDWFKPSCPLFIHETFQMSTRIPL